MFRAFLFNQSLFHRTKIAEKSIFIFDLRPETILHIFVLILGETPDLSVMNVNMVNVLNGVERTWCLRTAYIQAVLGLLGGSFSR